MNDGSYKRRSHSRSHSRSPYLLPEVGRAGKRKESPSSDTSSERKRSRKGPPLASPAGKALTSISEGNIPRSLNPSSNSPSPIQLGADALSRGRGASLSPLETKERKHKHRRRDAEGERKYEVDRRAESPSRRRRQGRPEDSFAREAGEISEGRHRDRDGRARHSRERHSSHSRPRPRETSNEAFRSGVDGSSREREVRSERAVPSFVTNFASMPDVIRQAALDVKQSRDAQLAEQAQEIAAKPSKHPPIVYTASDSIQAPESPRKVTPKKESKPLSATERAEQELAVFKDMQTLEIHLDAPAAFKPSPSGSDSEAGEVGRSVETSAVEAEAEPTAAIRSRWAVDDDEDLPVANGQANGEEAGIAALNAAERQELELAQEMVERDEDRDPDINISDIQRARPIISMLNDSRSVNSFEKLNRISEGTYGVVYRARDRQTGDICALKQIKMQHEKDGFPLTSIREINILLCFQHKNIVDVSEVVVGKGLDDVYMVMEYMEHDLRKLMETMPVPFTVAETKNLMKQLLEGMEYLHSNWVLHRDLKTSNILYNNKGQLKICDFGLARQYGSPLRPYTRNVVTLYYRAIELLLGATEYSTAIDIWSLGCIMAELLTKRVLFQGASEIDQIDKVFRILGSPTDEIWPGHKELDGVKKLKLRPQDRTIREVMPAASRFDPNSGLTEAGFDLLERMLALDPRKRISAEQALRHQWFQELPRVRDGYLMPTYPTGRAGTSRSILPD